MFTRTPQRAVWPPRGKRTHPGSRVLLMMLMMLMLVESEARVAFTIFLGCGFFAASVRFCLCVSAPVCAIICRVVSCFLSKKHTNAAERATSARGTLFFELFAPPPLQKKGGGAR